MNSYKICMPQDRPNNSYLECIMMGKVVTGQLPLRVNARATATHRHVEVCGFRFGARLARHQHRCWQVVRAGNDDKAGGSSKETQDAEDRLEALEASAVGRKSAEDYQTDASGIPETSWSDWKEGELLPVKWDELNVVQRAAELYMGKRGLLFWLNKFAFASVFVIGALWIIFRFVGPQLGLYELRSTISDIPL